MSTQITVNAQIRRAEIEAHIRHCRNEALRNLVEIGRWLNTAKQEGVVAHGQWTQWAQEHSGLSERDMQRAMQIARELPEGSPLERLGVTKISALLTLPASEREEFAERIGAEKLSSREVEQQVKAARAERDEALRVVGEQKKRLREMAQEKSALVTDVRKQVEAEQSREMHRLAVAAKSAEIDKQQAELQLDGAREALEAAKAHARQLQQELDQEKMQKSMPDPAQLLEISKLRETIAKKEREIDRLSDELDAAQTAAMRGGMSGSADRPSPSTVILSAIGALMAQAGRAPGELARQQGMMDAETREILCGQARLVGQWAMQILAACGEGEAHV